MDKSLVFDSNTETFDYGYSNGRIITDNIEAQIYQALFNEARATSSEVITPEYRSGFWGAIFGDEGGGKIWLNNGRKTNENLNRIVDYAKKSLQFLIDNKKLISIDVSGSFNDNGIDLNIILTYKTGSTNQLTVGV